MYLYNGLLFFFSVECIGGIWLILLIKCVMVMCSCFSVIDIGCLFSILFFVFVVFVLMLSCMMVLYVLFVLSKFCENLVVLLKYRGSKLVVSGLSVLVCFVFLVYSRCLVWISVLLFD